MAKIAVITGASSGMGRIFAETIDRLGEQLDEVWVIARRLDRLSAIKCPYPVKPVSLDLSDRESFAVYEKLLRERQADVRLLVNASGYGKFDAFMENDLATNLNMVDLNCQAVMALCQMTIPYMGKGARIINIASMAALQPTPYINVYSATKAFVLSFSRALNRELAKKGVHVMALCPYWTKTEFFSRAIDRQKDAVVKKYIVMYDAAEVVSHAWKDLLRGKDVSRYGTISNLQALCCKLLPHSWIMRMWQWQQKL